MRILEDHQHRSGAGQGFYLRDECFQRSLPALLRGELDRGITSIVRQRQHLGKERGILRRCRGLLEHTIELVEFRWRAVVARQSGSTFHLADDRVKRTVSADTRTPVPPWRHASTMIQWRQPSARAWLQLDWFASADEDCNECLQNMTSGKCQKTADTSSRSHDHTPTRPSKRWPAS